MKTRIRFVLIAVALLPFSPGVALAGICFNVTGLPGPVAFDFVPLESSAQGQLPIVGEAHQVCGGGTSPGALEGTVTVEPDGVARAGFTFLSSGPECSGGEAEIVLLPPYTSGNGQVRLQEGSVANVVLTHDPTGSSCVAIASAPDPNVCVPNATTLCLLQNRFKVLTTGYLRVPVPGKVFQTGSESGSFYYANPSNPDVLVQVKDGCGINNRFWVFAAATTNVRYTLTVTDTETGNVKSYMNPLRNPAAPIQDTAAFATCP